MRKKALHKDIRQEIKRTFPRFLSLFLMSALGVSFFSGVRASMPDMLSTTDTYLKNANLFDLQIVSTMGLQEEDLQAVLDTEGIEAAELAYSADLFCDADGEQYVVHLMSEGDMAQCMPKEGRLPEGEKEVFLDTALAKALGCAVGDQVTFYAEDGEELKDTLKQDTYEVVGIGDSPLYLSMTRGSASIGNGQVTGFAVTAPQAFSMEVYTQMNVQIADAETYECYSEEYKELASDVQKRLEDTTAETQSQWRYDQIKTEAEQELADARKELDDGKSEAEQELADARKELDDGWAELTDGEKQLADGKQQIADGESQISQSEQELADARSQLEEARQQAADGQAQVDAGWAELQAQEDQLNQAEEELNSKKAELEAGEADYAAGQQELQAQEEQLLASRAEFESKQAELEQAEQALEEGKAQIQAAREELQSYLDQAQEAQAALPELEAQLAALEASLGEEGSPEYEETSQRIQELQIRYQSAQEAAGSLSQLEAQLTQLDQQEESLAPQVQKLEEGKAQIQEAELQITDGEARFQAAKEEAESQLAQAREQLDSGWQQISDAEAQIASGREQIAAACVQLEAAQAEVDSGNSQIASYEQQIADGESQLAEAKAELESAKAELPEQEQKLADARKELEDGEKEYEDGRKEAQEEIADGEQKLADAQQELDDLEFPEWYVQDREDSVEDYGEMEDNAEQIGAIGKVFPLIFFLVAALVSLTTMTRMVEEQRVHIGTMKALGYRKADVAMKYLWYAGSATLGGGICGILIGQKLFPYIIQISYGIMYDCLNQPEIPYRPMAAIQALLISFLCILAATAFSCLKELREVPAELMRPEAPKKGKRVLLEYLPFIWKHLNFTTKSTFRNLFLYKKRFFMTIFGISATMALLVTGFGLRDSIIDLAEIQYDNIQLYDAMVTMNGTEEEKESFSQWMEKEPKVQASTMVHMLMMDVSTDSGSGEVYVCVPENQEDFQEMTVLKNRVSEKAYTLSDDGVLLTEWMSETLDVDEGDILLLEGDGKDAAEVKVSGVVENYIMNYLYMTPALYEKVFHEKPEYEVMYVELTEQGVQQEEEIGAQILEQPGVYNVSYTSDTKREINDMLQALVLVIIVLIITAALLAYVVLYNLNNVNITERRRELATLKVLGFYDMEVAQYVYHENILLTAIGIAAGVFMGIVLHQYIIHTIRVDTVMFGQHVSAVSFLISAVLTAFFSAFVNFVMYFKLKEIDMVESLKSVE